MSDNNNNIVNQVGVHAHIPPAFDSQIVNVGVRINLPPQSQVVNFGGRVAIPAANDSLGDRIPHVAVNALGKLPDFRLQSKTAASTVNVGVTEKERETLQPLIEQLASLLEVDGDGIGTIKPSLDIIIMIKPDGTRETLYGADLSREAQEIFTKIKLHYHTSHGGLARPSFNSQEKSNAIGFKPFSSRVTADPKASKFVDTHFQTISKGMTEKQKAKVLERIHLAEITIARKTALYDKLIKGTIEKLKTATGPEKKQLQADLNKLVAKHNEIKTLDPHAIYWLAAFYPKDPTDEKECIKQSKAVFEAAYAATKNSTYAHDLAAVLLPGRERYFNYCSEHHLQMKNTQPMEAILKSIVDLEKEGQLSPVDEANVKAEYKSEYVQNGAVKIENHLHTKAVEEVQRAVPVKAEIKGKHHLAGHFVQARASGYHSLSRELAAVQKPAEMESRLNAREAELQRERGVAFDLLDDVPAVKQGDAPKVDRSMSTPDLIALLERTAAQRMNPGLILISKDNLQHIYNTSSDDRNRIHQVKKNIERLEARAQQLDNVGLEQDEKDYKQNLDPSELNDDFELQDLEKKRFKRLSDMFPYFRDNVDEQQAMIPAMRKALKRKEYEKEEIARCERLIMNAEIKEVFREMLAFNKDTNPQAFATSAMAGFTIPSGDTGLDAEGFPNALSNLLPAVSKAVRRMEKRICESAKHTLNPIGTHMRRVDNSLHNPIQLSNNPLNQNNNNYVPNIPPGLV